jgi:aerobic carbon-monoxide dehydrogenase medium subunit
MKPRQFEYFAPKSVDDAVALLAQHGDGARLLAGGQSLLPMMNFRLVSPEVLIDLNRVGDLAYIRAEGDAIRIGAMTRQRTLEFSPQIKSELPLLSATLPLIGHLPTRSRGTIGGSLSHNDPAAELPMMLNALDGEVSARGPKGTRVIAAKDFFSGSMSTTLNPNEILVDIKFPRTPKNARFAVEEFSRRKGDFAIAAVAVLLIGTGTSIKQVSIATAGVTAHSVRLSAAEQVLLESGATEAAIAQAAKAGAESIEPLSDTNASGEFRRHLTRVLTERAVRRALDQRSAALH